MTKPKFTLSINTLKPNTFSDITKKVLQPISNVLEEAVTTLASTNDTELNLIIDAATNGTENIISKKMWRHSIPIIGKLISPATKLTPKELVSQLAYYDKWFDLIEESLTNRINLAQNTYKALAKSIENTNESKEQVKKLRDKWRKELKSSDPKLALLDEGKHMMMTSLDNAIAKALVYNQLISTNIKSLVQLKNIIENQRHEIKNDVMAQATINEYQKHAKWLATFHTNIQKMQKEYLWDLVQEAWATQTQIDYAIKGAEDTIGLVKEASQKLLAAHEGMKTLAMSMEEADGQREAILEEIKNMDTVIQKGLSSYNSDNYETTNKPKTRKPKSK